MDTSAASWDYTTLTLNAAERAVLALPVNGQGGFQSFLRRLQQSLEADGTILLCDTDLGRIFRMAAYAKGDGGFEGRLRKVFGRSLAMPFVCEQRSLAIA